MAGKKGDIINKASLWGFSFGGNNKFCMSARTYTLKNNLGLHARAAAMLVQVSNKFKSRIYLERDGRQANGKSILGILTLACPKGSSLTVRAEGSDAEKALDEIGALIENKFGED